MFGLFRPKAPRELLIRQREDAALTLIQCREHAEYYSAMSAMLAARIERIDGELLGQRTDDSFPSAATEPDVLVLLDADERLPQARAAA
jgi:hypothetical protein